jgi:hypothetical protein
MLVLIKKVTIVVIIEFNLLAIVAGKKLYVYKYDPKKITDEKFVPFR